MDPATVVLCSSLLCVVCARTSYQWTVWQRLESTLSPKIARSTRRKPQLDADVDAEPMRIQLADDKVRTLPRCWC